VGAIYIRGRWPTVAETAVEDETGDAQSTKCCQVKHVDSVNENRDTCQRSVQWSNDMMTGNSLSCIFDREKAHLKSVWCGCECIFVAEGIILSRRDVTLEKLLDESKMKKTIHTEIEKIDFHGHHTSKENPYTCLLRYAALPVYSYAHAPPHPCPRAMQTEPPTHQYTYSSFPIPMHTHRTPTPHSWLQQRCMPYFSAYTAIPTTHCILARGSGIELVLFGGREGRECGEGGGGLGGGIGGGVGGVG